MRFKSRSGMDLIEQMEFFAGFETYGFAGCNAYFRAGARVASDACFTGFNVENTESAEFDAVAFPQGILHCFEDRVYGRFCLDARQPGSFYDTLDEVLLDQ